MRWVVSVSDADDSVDAVADDFADDVATDGARGVTGRVGASGAPLAARFVAPRVVRLRAAAAAIADAHPFAPGGDDLLPHSDADARSARLAPLARPLMAGGLHSQTQASAGAWPTVPRAVLQEPAQRGAAPLPVQKTSDAILKQVDFDLHRQPSLRELGLLPATLAASQGDPKSSPAPDLQTVGDFFQEGRAARWALALSPKGASRVYVLARDEQGRWSDRSAELLPLEADRQACHRPSQALTADINGDGKPDVYLACDGQQLLFISQADGQYRRLSTPFLLSAIDAHALDVDGDGLVDVVTMDIQTGAPRALVLYGRGDGCFGVQLLDPASSLAQELHQRTAANQPPVTGSTIRTAVGSAAQGRP